MRHETGIVLSGSRTVRAIGERIGRST